MTPETILAVLRATSAPERPTPITDAAIEADSYLYQILYPSRKDRPVRASRMADLERQLAAKTEECEGWEKQWREAAMNPDPNNLEGPPRTREEMAENFRKLNEIAPTPAEKLQLMFGSGRPTPITDQLRQTIRDLYKECLLCGDGMGVLLADAGRFENLERQLAAAIRERDNALSDWREADSRTVRALHERNEAREQRDRLVDALAAIMVDPHSGRAMTLGKKALEDINETTQ